MNKDVKDYLMGLLSMIIMLGGVFVVAYFTAPH
jgi:hypothetical protein